MQSRPLPVTVAAVLMVLIGLSGLPGPFLLKSDAVPAVVLYGGIVLGVVGLIASVGLWLLKRWSLWLTVVVSALNLLLAAPGIPFAPGGLKVFAAVTVLVSAVIIVLVVRPVSRRALTAS
jgi:uncharacterized membrane protein (DUF2068 family)